ncbi:hypothetical protein CEUSTIGMA_g7190.t1 [Chlamydomonas eustigma]|uniref:Tyrosine specific protein phosphatases domain-containing protein n=1 Tax=Chlamydomonas eustigma TaxID=1157962 RepID=A0A250XA29_9CHLO|nr:hypothetical protein CEUSTIGMA_g7190.t1 [Chlamydomonas eustigma]|eukprot:GAX79749.1 hypothetical protein CEUSTIGMA_g7190.t1 [Chlamydomonas eustigma]
MRCAQPINASEEDIDKLLQQIGILELVDLRSGEEMMGDLPGSKLLSIAELQRHERCASGQVIPKEPILIPSKTLVRHNVSLLDREVNAGGLGLLYKIILDSAQPEICAVMNLILKALKNARPVLIFCKAGKDRTGLISALILGVAGCSDEEIVADYIKSDSFRKVALAGIENKKELRGLDFSKFEGAPAEAMEEALLYIRSKYGSPSDYLVSIGFGEAVQTEMRLLLR